LASQEIAITKRHLKNGDPTLEAVGVSCGLTGEDVEVLWLAIEKLEQDQTRDSHGEGPAAQ